MTIFYLHIHTQGHPLLKHAHSWSSLTYLCSSMSIQYLHRITQGLSIVILCPHMPTYGHLLTTYGHLMSSFIHIGYPQIYSSLIVFNIEHVVFHLHYCAKGITLKLLFWLQVCCGYTGGIYITLIWVQHNLLRAVVCNIIDVFLLLTTCFHCR